MNTLTIIEVPAGSPGATLKMGPPSRATFRMDDDNHWWIVAGKEAILGPGDIACLRGEDLELVIPKRWVDRLREKFVGEHKASEMLVKITEAYVSEQE